jgi:hypothetical protein
MSRPAHVEGLTPFDNRRPVMTQTAHPMVQQIEHLLSADAPSLARVEDALTEGYAQALQLEAEKLRLERRLGEVARMPNGDHGDELRSLGSRLRRADGEIEKLRSLLGSLNARARTLRAAS